MGPIEIQRRFAERFCNLGYLGFNRRDGETLRDAYRGRLDADYSLSRTPARAAERLLGRCSSLLDKILGAIGHG